MPAELEVPLVFGHVAQVSDVAQLRVVARGHKRGASGLTCSRRSAPEREVSGQAASPHASALISRRSRQFASDTIRKHPQYRVT